ncbi:hypothetical protein EYV94_18030 [Puteibacter caeruleilacunae]|nr:hypothetical protein EYV94_18030 [Puteibacter caeruleilacunae]
MKMVTHIRTNTNFDRIQLQIISFVWILIFAFPLLFSGYQEDIQWRHVFKMWIEYGLVFIVFLINHLLLFPHLFLKGKRVLYFVSVIGVLILLVVTIYQFGTVEIRPPMDMKPPLGGRNVPMRPPGGGPAGVVPPFANLLVISILLIGFDVGLTFAGKWLQAEQNKIILEKENVENKMAFLQNQISPHFFMNTLNNIHALVDINTEEAKDAIIRLSKMMAYMLYESQASTISIHREIEFVKSYVELMRLRFSEEVEIKLNIPEILPDIAVPPLLTISFLENAFKHGISYEKSSYIHINYAFTAKRMFFKIENTVNTRQAGNANSGIGLQNIQKRLALIYEDDYDLNINQIEDKVFTVNLNIPL